MFLVTMLPAPITARLPMRTPGRTTAFEPIQTWSSMITGSDRGNSPISLFKIGQSQAQYASLSWIFNILE
jgi:hypothetical protein